MVLSVVSCQGIVAASEDTLTSIDLASVTSSLLLMTAATSKIQSSPL